MPTDKENNDIAMKREVEGQAGRRLAEELIQAGKDRKATAKELIEEATGEEEVSAQELIQATKTPKKVKFRNDTRLKRLASRLQGYGNKTNERIIKAQKTLMKKKISKRNFVVLANGQHRFISKNQYKQLRQQKRIPKARAVYSSGINPSDNIGENILQLNQQQFDLKERSRWRNSFDVNHAKRLVAMRRNNMRQEREFQLHQNNNLMMSHKRMLSPEENRIMNIEQNDILNDNFNIMRQNENSINILDTKGRPNILQNQSMRWGNVSEMNPLSAPQLNFGNVSLTGENQNKRKPQPKISFW